MEIALIENLQRKDLNAFEEADGLEGPRRDVRLHAREDGRRSSARAARRSPRSLSLTAMPAEVRELCRLADIHSKSLLLQIVRQSTPEKMVELIERLQSRGRDDAAAGSRSRVKRRRPRTRTSASTSSSATSRRRRPSTSRCSSSAQTCRARRSCARCSRSSTSCMQPARERNASAERDTQALELNVAASAFAQCAIHTNAGGVEQAGERSRLASRATRPRRRSAMQKSGATISRSLL